jgi:hypothetical protein
MRFRMPLVAALSVFVAVSCDQQPVRTTEAFARSPPLRPH